VLYLAGFVLGMVSWRNLLTGMGHPLRPGPAMRVYGAAMLGKYLPGPFWSALAMVQTARASGVPVARTVAAYALNSALVLLTAGVVGLFAAPAVLRHSAPLTIPAVLVLIVLLYRPQLIIQAAGLIAAVLRRPRPTVALEAAPLRRSIGVQTLSWLVGGLHLGVIVAALGGPLDPRSLMFYSGSFALAAAAGMLALVVPDGAGVRELVLTVALTSVLSMPQTITAVVVSRLACTVAEVFGSLTALTLAGWLARRGAASASAAGP
jgi:uncharacterized membrane protein YbhN (UPF0104 family)